MSVTVDANVLLYASDSTGSLHRRARDLVTELAAGPALLYLFWPVLMAYLRVSTHTAVFEAPLSPETAVENVRALLARPHIRTPGEGEDFWDTYQRVTTGVTARGNLVPDAHLVALMHQYGVRTIWTRDRDFRKFAGVEVRDPFDT